LPALPQADLSARFQSAKVVLVGTTGKTGGIDVSNGPQTVPEPASLALLSAGFIGLGMIRRRAANA